MPVAERLPPIDVEGVRPGRRDPKPSQRAAQSQTRSLRRRLFERPDQGQQLRVIPHQVAQAGRFCCLGDIVEQPRIVGANLLDVDPHRCQGDRRHPESVRVTDRAVKTQLRGKVRSSIGPVGNRRVCRQRVSTLSEVRVCLAKSEPPTHAVGQPIVPDARHHLFTDAANGHALG